MEDRSILRGATVIYPRTNGPMRAGHTRALVSPACYTCQVPKQEPRLRLPWAEQLVQEAAMPLFCTR